MRRLEHHLVGLDNQPARSLRAEILAEQVAEGIFTQSEAEAMQEPGATTTSWLPANSRRPGHTLVLVDKGLVTAAADLFGGDVPGECVLENFAVRRSSQGQGYFPKLWRLVQDDARRNAMTTIIIVALVADQHAVDYWRHVLDREPSDRGSMTCAGKTFDAVGWHHELK